MSDEMKPCPFCSSANTWVDVFDCEGNYRGPLGCDYEKEAWSGVRYGIQHVGSVDCLCCTDGDEPIGGMLFESVKDAVKAWNSRAERTCRLKQAAGGRFCSNCNAFIPDGFAPMDACGPMPVKYCPNCRRKVVRE